MHLRLPHRLLRIGALLLCALLPACASPAPVVALLAADVATVGVFGRGIVDVGVSAISGRDCSIVRLDRGLAYCAPLEQTPLERFCTRTLAAVDCWDGLAPPPVGTASLPRPGVGDTPPPSRAQLHYRAARWPKALTYE